jgi:hypothetical protein
MHIGGVSGLIGDSAFKGVAMLTLQSPTLTVVKKTANGLIKALRAAHSESEGFAIRRENGENIALVERADCADCADYEVLIGETIVRVIPADLVVQTARLYTDVARLRKTLASAACMVIRPVRV